MKKVTILFALLACYGDSQLNAMEAQTETLVKNATDQVVRVGWQNPGQPTEFKRQPQELIPGIKRSPREAFDEYYDLEPGEAKRVDAPWEKTLFVAENPKIGARTSLLVRVLPRKDLFKSKNMTIVISSPPTGFAWRKRQAPYMVDFQPTVAK